MSSPKSGFDINRRHGNRVARWHAEGQVNGSYRVDFTADRVESTHWVATDDQDLLAKVASEMAVWVAVVSKLQQGTSI